MEVQMSWQVQEAKQRFSEVLRAVETEGPQTITRHGDEVAILIDIAEYRKLKSQSNRSFVEELLSWSELGDEVADVLDEIVAERKKHRPREIDFSDAE
jgi:prevent-host-death family protein